MLLFGTARRIAGTMPHSVLRIMLMLLVLNVAVKADDKTTNDGLASQKAGSKGDKAKGDKAESKPDTPEAKGRADREGGDAEE